MTREEIIAWGQQLARDKAWVMYLPARRVGQVAEFYDGVEKVVPCAEQVDMRGYVVIQLSTGDTLHADPENFLVFTADEVRLQEAVTSVLSAVIAEIGALVVSTKIAPARAIPIVASVLQAQASAMVAPSMESY